VPEKAAETIEQEGAEKGMHTAEDLWIAFNSIFLDIVPLAALAALAVSWFLRKKRFDREEETLRSRISMYHDRMAEPAEGEDESDLS